MRLFGGEIENGLHLRLLSALPVEVVLDDVQVSYGPFAHVILAPQYASQLTKPRDELLESGSGFICRAASLNEKFVLTPGAMLSIPLAFKPPSIGEFIPISISVAFGRLKLVDKISTEVSELRPFLQRYTLISVLTPVKPIFTEAMAPTYTPVGHEDKLRLRIGTMEAEDILNEVTITAVSQTADGKSSASIVTPPRVERTLFKQPSFHMPTRRRSSSNGTAADTVTPAAPSRSRSVSRDDSHTIAATTSASHGGHTLMTSIAQPSVWQVVGCDGTASITCSGNSCVIPLLGPSQAPAHVDLDIPFEVKMDKSSDAPQTNADYTARNMSLVFLIQGTMTRRGCSTEFSVTTRCIVSAGIPFRVSSQCQPSFRPETASHNEGTIFFGEMSLLNMSAVTWSLSSMKVDFEKHTSDQLLIEVCEAPEELCSDASSSGIILNPNEEYSIAMKLLVRRNQKSRNYNYTMPHHCIVSVQFRRACQGEEEETVRLRADSDLGTTSSDSPQLQTISSDELLVHFNNTSSFITKMDLLLPWPEMAGTTDGVMLLRSLLDVQVDVTLNPHHLDGMSETRSNNGIGFSMGNALSCLYNLSFRVRIRGVKLQLHISVLPCCAWAVLGGISKIVTIRENQVRINKY